MVVTRIARTLAALALTLAGLAAMPTAASAATAPSVSSAHSAHPDGSITADDVDAFSYASWDARYELGLDDEGRPLLHVTETLVARFPDFDQNRGIVRGLPTGYEGARIDTQVLSVTDEDGTDVPYETETDDGVLYILTGTDDYVQGLTTYVIEYSMRDVILAADTGVDEFYWDLLPFDSTQAIEAFRADIVLDASLGDHLTGEARCYSGSSGSTRECPIQGPTTDGDTTVFHVESGERAAGDGVTVAIGFAPGTAVQTSARQPNPVTDTVPAVAAAGALALSIGGWFAVSASTRRRHTADGIIVAQYDVPDSLPPLLAAAIIPGAKDPIPAEIVHLAVRGALRIEEGSEKAQPRLRRMPGARTVDPLDAAALEALFVGADADGVASLPASSESFATRMTSLTQSGKNAAQAQGFTTRARSGLAMTLQWCAIGIVGIGLALALWGVISGRLSAIPAMVAIGFGVVLVLISSFFTFSKHTVLTLEGARRLEYLKGVEEFIRVAEADRLRMLQSYSGAERRQDGSANVILLYERLLPYAMLFGMEDEWGRVLENAYSIEQRGPGWIGDPTSPYLRVQLAAFAVTSHASATYTAPSASSSSSGGGSFGGGFAGGGGGGGFSGGR
ncbi:MAG: DUF2207 domain-containing protein [Candidatus Microbacterium colombiense]|nr:MAG: DUF2207 domain-containing protein [Microbacterium sp.]